MSLSKIRMYEYWYDGMTPKYGDNIKLCYMDTESFIMHDGKVDKKAKGTKKCVIKRCLMFDNFSECLKEKKKILRSQQRFKRDGHDVYTGDINKIASFYNDDKRLIAFDGITTYPYGISIGILCNQELLYQESVNS